ncbi:MAG: dehydrogenase E1 component subunit alpha/beta [Acidobacteriota bacterium]|nr:dehydrogenase E1 component subunit alpha/beta [Acidobacteriota bacterium]MDH3522013.1 dehydrogenase E1 component subunit alpha/beta [Acidobacteriota bacterium]
MNTPRDRLVRYAFMKLARDFDARFERLLKTGRVAKWYSEAGNEGTTVPAGLALEPGDALCTLHRDLGAILPVYLDPARTFPGFGFGDADGRRRDPGELLFTLACQLLGKAPGFSQGVERSFHYGYFDPRAGIHHIGMISHLGAMIPVAAGAALAHELAGSGRLAINFIGDGGTSTGDFHEGLNMAAVWKLPLVVVVENNRYAFSTPTTAQYAAQRLSDRGPGYGVRAMTVDGNDPDVMAEVLAEAVAQARGGGGPTLVEAMVGRMRGHSEADDSLKVVPPEELAAYQAADPVPYYATRLQEEGILDAVTRQRLEAHIGALVEESIAAALEADPPAPKVARRRALAPAPLFGAPAAAAGGSAESTTYVDAIRQALLLEMERDERLILLGQDIGVFEGAFRVTRGMYARWPERVRDTPIAESGALGVAVGLALAGYPTVVEMQFADFVSCGFNQIVNVAAKLYYRWQVACPIVVRLPSGGGVTAGPFHSQNPEAWFTHVAGLKVVCPATARDAAALLSAAIRDPNPVIFCEHKFLYRRVKEDLPPEVPPADLGIAEIRRAGSDATLVGYGAATWTCLEAAEKLAGEGVSCEVVDLRTLVPLDEDTVLASVRRTGRAVIVHEAQRTGGFGAEVAARIAEGAFAWLDAPVRRVAYPDRPVPYARLLELELLPGVDAIVDAVRASLAF